MSSIKHFKSIADEIMNGVDADETLKAKTLRRCETKPSPFRKLVPAAAFAVIAAVTIIAVTLTPGGESDIPNVMMASSSPGANVSVQPADIEDAKDALGASLLEPEYVPEGFSMQQTDVINENGYVYLTLQFTDRERSYLIIEEKTQIPLEFEDYKAADVNGIQAYIISASGGELQTEVHWIIGGVHYAVMGQISEEEALSIARSMK